MPVTSRSRTIAAAPEDVWRVVGDPHHLARWWPRVARVEVVGDGSFTQLLASKNGRLIRADFRIITREAPRHVAWEQEVEGTPFARILAAAHTDIALEPAAGTEGTRVTVELRQSLHGFFSRFGGFMVSRATRTLLDEALASLEEICA